MIAQNWSRFGRVLLGGAVLVGLSYVVGLDSQIEAKPPTGVDGMLRDITPAPRQPQAGVRDRLPALDTAAVTAPAGARINTAVVVPSERIATPPRALPATSAPASGQATAQGGPRFELTGAEKISIKFHGYQDLSGDYRVNPDETLSIPALGRISISRLTAAELEVVLADRAARITGRDSYITVEVAEYRPIFVSGLVARPGSHAWQPGMTVLHAVTLLGGIFRATPETSGGVVIGADAEILRLRRSINDQKRLLASLARYRAERANNAIIDVPEQLVALVGRAEAQALVAEQNSVLANRRSSLSAQLAALERAKAIAQQEMTGLVAQGQRLREMLEQRRTYKQKIEGLQAKGIVRADRAMDEQSRLAELEDRATTVSVGVARVQSTLASLEREMINLRQERVADIDQEIFKLAKENAQLELIESARAAYFKFTGAPAPMTFGDKEAPKTMVVEYQLVRYEGGVQSTTKADQFTRLKPGDIIIVDVQKD